MKRNIEVIIKKYEDQECFTSDFAIESIAKKAYSGEKEKVERLIKYLEDKYPDQLEFINELKEHQLTEIESPQESKPTLATEHMVEHVAESVSESEAKQETSQASKPVKDSAPAMPHNHVPEATEEQTESNDTSSQERQYHPGMEYEINPDKKVDIHPAANTMPMMSNSEFFGLVKDIKDNGQIVPILTLNGVVIDGRNRLEACKKLAMPAKAKEISENTDIAKLVVTLNEQRRNLSTSQKAACAVLYMEETKVSEGRSREVVGNIFKVGGSSVQKAKKIKDTNEELFFKLHRDEVSLQAAMKEIKKDDHPKIENDLGYSDDEGCVELSKFFPKGKVDDLSDLADKCSGKLKKILKTLLKHVSGEITAEKIAPMVLNNSNSTELEVTNECA